MLKTLWLIVSLLSGGLPAAEWVASTESGWPQFRGPRRNGISDEKGLLQSWPATGPRELWSATNLGSGYSSPVFSHDRIFITGEVGDDLRVFALDLQGRLQWMATNGAAWKGPYPGARACCAYASNRVYHLNGHGRLACFDARDGGPIWSVDVIREFESREPTWGIAECLLVDRGRVFVTPGGRNASMAALDAESGRIVWRSLPLVVKKSAESPDAATEGPGYASPILIDLPGQRQIVGASARHFLGVNADTGELQWTFTMPTQYGVIACIPTLCGEGVFVTAPDAGGGKLLRLVNRGEKIEAERAWTTTLDTCHGGIIALGGFLYGSWYRDFNGWGCVNLKDGTVAYSDREMAMGSVIHADGRLYCLSQSGTMALIMPNPEKWDVVSRFEFAREKRNDVWAHPVILDGRLYLRHQQTLRCLDVRRSGTP
jgi:outer membrane protein assembly factor BamB